jgi:hypothetical protein
MIDDLQAQSDEMGVATSSPLACITAAASRSLEHPEGIEYSMVFAILYIRLNAQRTNHGR